MLVEVGVSQVSYDVKDNGDCGIHIVEDQQPHKRLNAAKDVYIVIYETFYGHLVLAGREGITECNKKLNLLNQLNISHKANR